MSEYQEILRKAILATHGTDAVHIASVAVKEVVPDQGTCEGMVEVFELVTHPAAKRSYAWGYPFNTTEPLNIFTVLEAASISSPEDAFRSTMGSHARN